MSNKRYDFVVHEQASVRSATKLLYVTSAKYSGDWHSTPHTHNCSELFYVTGGAGQFFIEGEIHPVSPNDLVIVNPNVEHTEISLNANPLEYIVLGVDGLELSAADQADDSYCIVNFRAVKDTILFYLQNMLKEIEAGTPGYETICQDLMEILIILLMRQTDYSVTLTPIRKKASKLCASVRRYIDIHYKENINLDMLAQISHVSKYYLVHAFTKEYGISPMNYLLERRLEEAKQLLKNDDYSLSIISQMLGFSSPSYFSQIFKKNENMSPNEYRKASRMRNEEDASSSL
ncbi:MAG: helix-turn-helix transcriptional regulator [Lachnospiraceae bacterium]|nr:helix-turn-helix transcriptional regulator [Lachnospiraceae bacterium]